MVSFLSAVTLLGTPSEVYMFGTMYVYQGKQFKTINHLVSMMGHTEEMRPLHKKSGSIILDRD